MPFVPHPLPQSTAPPLMVWLEFLIAIILPAAVWPWGRLSLLTKMSARNISWRVKAAGAYGWQPYLLHFAIVMKSGSLNLLEPSGPVQGLLYLLQRTSRVNSTTNTEREREGEGGRETDRVQRWLPTPGGACLQSIVIWMFIRLQQTLQCEYLGFVSVFFV